MTEELRYTVGQEYLFIRVIFETTPGVFAPLYLPWCCHNATVELVKLKCIEHRRVPNRWTDKLNYDGFIFVDEENRKWYNQYPTASYGQLDDSFDRKVHLADFKQQCEPNRLFRHWQDLPSWIENIMDGEDLGGFSPEQKEMLSAHRKDIEKMVEEKYHLKVVHNVGDFPLGGGSTVTLESLS